MIFCINIHFVLGGLWYVFLFIKTNIKLPYIHCLYRATFYQTLQDSHQTKPNLLSFPEICVTGFRFKVDLQLENPNQVFSSLKLTLAVFNLTLTLPWVCC